MKSESGYQLYRNGQPFMVAGGAGGNQLEALAKAGGNTIRVYHPDSLYWMLDEAERLGLAVIADLPIPPYYSGDDTTYQGASFLALKDEISDYVLKYKDHPALLFWILGNEIQLSAANAKYRRAFNLLVDEIHALDPDHPVSTAIVAHDLINIYLNLNKFAADFVCINVFGNISDFTLKKGLFSLIWKGPYLISECGNNGYWEEGMTLWNAPIEPASLTKARQLGTRYRESILSLDDGRCLGNLVFFWGSKYERTPTWFSFFDEEGHISERVVEMGRIWGGLDTLHTPPALEYLLVNGKGPYDNVLLEAGQPATAAATYSTRPSGNIKYTWELFRENWFDEKYDPHLPDLNVKMEQESLEQVVFYAPEQGGPYRLYLKVVDSSGYYAAANIPVFVLEENADE